MIAGLLATTLLATALPAKLSLASAALGPAIGVRDAASEGWTPWVHLRFATVLDTALSPDASKVAFSLRRAGDSEGESRFESRIWVAATDGKWQRPITAAGCSFSAPAFSFDGRRLAFLSTCSGSLQVWVATLDGESPRRITDAASGVTRFAWSPVDSRMAYLAADTAGERGADAKAEVLPGLTRSRERLDEHLFVLDVDDLAADFPETVQATWGAYHIADFDWAPSGSRLAAAVVPGPGADAALRASDLITVHLAGRAVRRRLRLTGMPGTEIGPRWSPDGRWVGFAASGERPEPIGLGDVWVVSAAGDDPRRLAPTSERSGSAPLGWTADGLEVLLAEPRGVSVDVVAVPLDGSLPRFVTSAVGHRQAFSRPVAGRLAYSFETARRPPEVRVLDLRTGEASRVAGIDDRVAMPPLGRTRVVEWRSTDGRRIEGLLTLLAGAGEASRLPLAVVLHGGPAASFTSTFTGRPEIYMVQSLAQAGYVVLRPNPRGSVGYGPGFRYAVVGDWGGHDAADVLTGVEEMVRRGVADPERVVVVGWGYGGYLAAALTTRTDRFRAVSVGAPLVALGSLALTTDIPAFLGAYMGGDIWETPEAYERLSLLSALGRTEVPMQIIHPEESSRIPHTQGVAAHRALDRRGVETELLLFEGASVAERPDTLASVQLAVHSWLNRHLDPEPSARPVERPPQQPRRTSFIRSEYEPYGRPANGVIEGRAYLVLPDGGRRYCARGLVFMNPVTTLSTEWYLRNVINREELEPISLLGYHWITLADEEGRFRFVDLPPGEYYLGCRVLEEEGFAHGRVVLAGAGSAFAELVRYVGSAGSPPAKPQVSSDVAHWGQLAGTWSCTVRTPDAEGNVSEARSIWSWEHILGGRGVRDEYLGIDDDGSVRFRGTAIRIYDPEAAEWDVAWADSASTAIRSYRATSSEGRITMRKAETDPEWRTVFYDITPTSFDWLNEPSGGRMRCVRDEGLRPPGAR